MSKKKGANALVKAEPVTGEIVGQTPGETARAESSLNDFLNHCNSVLGRPVVPVEMWAEVEQLHFAASKIAMHIGIRLVLLKKATPKGQFFSELEKRGIGERTAERCMFAAYAMLGKNLEKTNRLTLAEVSRGKLLELANMRDEDIDAIAAGETVDGINLDTLQTMTAKELRDRIRKGDSEIATLRKLQKESSETINQLKESNERLMRHWTALPSDERFAQRRGDVETEVAAIEAMLGDVGAAKPKRGLAGAIAALINEVGDADVDPRQEAGFIAAVLTRLAVSVRVLRDSLTIEIPESST